MDNMVSVLLFITVVDSIQSSSHSFIHSLFYKPFLCVVPNLLSSSMFLSWQCPQCKACPAHMRQWRMGLRKVLRRCVLWMVCSMNAKQSKENMQIDSDQIICFGTKHNSPRLKAPLPSTLYLTLPQVLYSPLLYSFLLIPCFPEENKYTDLRDESELLLKSVQ